MKSIKNIDVFAQPIFTFNTNRNKKTNKKEHTIKHGSIVGGILTIICFVCSISYFLFNIVKMNSGSYDSYYANVETSDGTHEHKTDFIKDMSFLPMI